MIEGSSDLKFSGDASNFHLGGGYNPGVLRDVSPQSPQKLKQFADIVNIF